MLKTIIFGGILRWAADGGTETVTMVEHTVGPAYQPRTSDNGGALFLPLGNAPSFNVTPKRGEVEVRGPTEGGYAYGHVETIITANDMEITAQLTQWSEITLQSVFQLAALPVIGDPAVEPLKQSAPQTGWLQLDAGDQSSTKILEGITYAELKVVALPGAEKKVDYGIVFTARKNALNTIEFPSAT